MKYLIIIILFINCTLFPSQQSQASKKRDSVIMSFLLCTFARAPFERYVSKDNMDGTINIRIEKVSGCGLVNSVSSGTLLKKCLQGQVYRQAQNDCKGTGSAADYYGAQKFQWCPTNDGSCDTGTGSLDVTISPIGKTCSFENLMNRKWSVISYLNSQTVKSYLDLNQEFPKEEYLWYNVYKFSLGYSEGPIVKLSQFENVQLSLKSSYNYVLCGI